MALISRKARKVKTPISEASSCFHPTIQTEKPFIDSLLNRTQIFLDFVFNSLFRLWDRLAIIFSFDFSVQEKGNRKCFRSIVKTTSSTCLFSSFIDFHGFSIQSSALLFSINQTWKPNKKNLQTKQKSDYFWCHLKSSWIGKIQFNLNLSVAVQRANPICGNLLAMFCWAENNGCFSGD